ncbi:MAG: hypothetical protein ABIE43_00455 [Patescibacteria group bacterium]
MIKLKISSSKIFFYFYSLIIFISLIIFVLVFLFLYKNFYMTITQSEEIITLRREVALDDIDMDKFEKITKEYKEKTKPRSLDVFIRF